MLNSKVNPVIFISNQFYQQSEPIFKYLHLLSSTLFSVCSFLFAVPSSQFSKLLLYLLLCICIFFYAFAPFFCALISSFAHTCLPSCISALVKYCYTIVLSLSGNLPLGKHYYKTLLAIYPWANIIIERCWQSTFKQTILQDFTCNLTLANLSLLSLSLTDPQSAQIPFYSYPCLFTISTSLHA